MTPAWIRRYAYETQTALGLHRTEGAYEELMYQLLVADGYDVQRQRDVFADVVVRGEARRVLVGRCDLIVYPADILPLLLELKAGVRESFHHYEQLGRYARDLGLQDPEEHALMVYFDYPAYWSPRVVPLWSLPREASAG